MGYKALKFMKTHIYDFLVVEYLLFNKYSLTKDSWKIEKKNTIDKMTIKMSFLFADHFSQNHATHVDSVMYILSQVRIDNAKT